MTVVPYIDPLLLLTKLLPESNSPGSRLECHLNLLVVNLRVVINSITIVDFASAACVADIISITDWIGFFHNELQYPPGGSVLLNEYTPRALVLTSRLKMHSKCPSMSVTNGLDAIQEQKDFALNLL